MTIEKLQQDILYCQEHVGNILIKNYDQEKYKEMVCIILSYAMNSSDRVVLMLKLYRFLIQNMEKEIANRVNNV